MNRTKLLESALPFLVGVAIAMLPAVAFSSGDSKPDESISLARIGHPTWKPVDFHVFSAPIGTAATGYAEFAATAQAVLPPPNHLLHPQLLIGPGAPHPPPYDSEVEEGIEAAGFHEGAVFRPLEFSYGSGVYLAWMNVAAPGTKGSSPDFISGRIIPNALFPIHVAGTLLQNGGPYDPYVGTFDVPALNDPSLTPSYKVDGASHFPVFYADNSDFGPPGAKVDGRYRYDIVMTDRTGSGWHIVADFVVSGGGVLFLGPPAPAFDGGDGTVPGVTGSVGPR